MADWILFGTGAAAGELSDLRLNIYLAFAVLSFGLQFFGVFCWDRYIDYRRWCGALLASVGVISLWKVLASY